MNAQATIIEPPRNVFLDLGSSHFGNWRGSSIFASGLWNYRTYHERGTRFSKFVAVEAKPLDPMKAYESIPDDLVGVYTLMNIYLSMDDGKLDVTKLIRSLTKNDFLVLKLDIDNAPIEAPLSAALCSDKELAGLVDEMYYEDHISLEPMNKDWRMKHAPRDLLDSYQIFQTLRRNGIRAHSWP